MTEQKLGNESAARVHYRRAVERMEQTYPRAPGLASMKDEAAALLGEPG